MEIRRLTTADASAFRTLRLFALRESPTAFGSSHAEERDQPASAVESWLSDVPGRGTWGAFERGELVGIVGLGRERLVKLSHKAVVRGLYVSPAARGRGIARALVLAAVSEARSVPGIVQLNLSVNARNAAAVRLYESIGFEAFGREPNALRIDGEMHEELHMALRLVRG